jgi:hypothetical protein
MSDISAMTETGEIIDHKLQMLVLERRNASRNMARFYVLARSIRDGVRFS